MLSTEPQPSSPRAARRQRGEADDKEQAARDLSFAALAQVAAIPLDGFVEADRRYVAAAKRKAAEAIRKIREYLPRRG